ncbi:Crp/Fnr family transcriptional regulator [Lacticaseibacillus pantheris]|jgi:CRP-like cAMP-binding protein|uniref:Crp/Fnr family transcriptional regulator n=1 Tax=Lacticaseibacillus pantheris TaxID=171523 RepID=UPI0025948AEA|nr:Crp/Fnr family transcriptional regulator [Lacticaseibacillus pantheris]WKF85025.1 Crp/Fnr family transcriptional regulator [Lacticaseibacillus pantheris]
MTATSDYDQVKHLGYLRHVEAHVDLLMEGDTAHQVFFIDHGGLRLWHNANGRDVTIQFFFEDQVVASFESLYLDTPSLFSITSIEPTTITVVDGATLRNAIQQNSDLMRTFTDHICHRFIDYTQYFLNRIEESPVDRYRSLLSEHPELVARVPQYELASYLGITSVSLSRIRQRVKKEATS